MDRFGVQRHKLQRQLALSVQRRQLLPVGLAARLPSRPDGGSGPRAVSVPPTRWCSLRIDERDHA